MEVAALEDVFAPLGPVQIRRMFGGRGIYADGLMFALEIGGVIYLKTCEANRSAFRESGSEPFRYVSRGAERETSYWRLPDNALDDPDILAGWVTLARQAATTTATVRRRGSLARKLPR
ncbi:TfoX/Sxy family protein [Bosea sp. TND4EK4]|uniref:TfoX/Sxy family protein n=1 Tax=Bosea sp. TND4EK4 TaxID=1907408 RepID=UPI000954901D|nr:TfoX/Sxy family protein [Bosea sp. TND4EK4]SIQ43731.1 DNA transformation protein [Bosea sp. TND4EK4]